MAVGKRPRPVNGGAGGMFVSCKETPPHLPGGTNLSPNRSAATGSSYYFATHFGLFFVHCDRL